MRLDHLSYATSHDQISDTIQRIGSRLGTTFVDGGIHPRFGTRNFTAPLIGGQYIEVVCPLDHPATEQTPWGKAVSQKAAEGGGWLTWVFSTDNIAPITAKFGRDSVEAHRTRPDGSDLKWKQIGVTEIAESRELPFFIEWQTEDHPSKDGVATARIDRITLSDSQKLENSWFKEEIIGAIAGVEIFWAGADKKVSEKGLVSIRFQTPNGSVEID